MRELPLSRQENMIAAVFPVNFPASSETAIQIEYDLRAVTEPKTPSLSLEYMMQTGSHWAGTIGSGKVIFEFWQPVDSKSALSYVNDFFQATDGAARMGFRRPGAHAGSRHHRHLRAHRPGDVGSAALLREGSPGQRTGCEGHPGRRLPAGGVRHDRRQLGTPPRLTCWTQPARGGAGSSSRPRTPGDAWLQIDLDRAHTVAGLLIRTGVLEQMWTQGPSRRRCMTPTAGPRRWP